MCYTLVMKYISYEEALKLIDAKKFWTDMSLDEANKQWLYQSIGGIRTVLHDGKMLIEKESLLEELKESLRPGPKSYRRQTRELTLQEISNDALNRSKSHQIAFVDGIEIEGHRLVVEELKASLKSPGKFKMFTCSCTDFLCGGAYIEVKHIDGFICWQIAYGAMGEIYPGSYLRGDIDGKKVFIPLPIYFSKDQLEALVK